MEWFLLSAVLAGLAFMFSASILLQILDLFVIKLPIRELFHGVSLYRMASCGDFWHSINNNAGNEHQAGDGMPNGSLKTLSACAIYNNWWPMLSALMYVLVPMPCLFFGGGSTQFLTSRDGGGWIDAAKFLTGASAVGSIAIPIILRHAHMIETGAMWIEFTSFVIFVCTVMCFHRASLEDEW
ncbi:hypothetical protein NC652_017398 [Populus alba x Populus x berolinensis]|nr:hypothetical protein NC652_017398 [Populus alba x Populus x berolinensis]